MRIAITLLLAWASMSAAEVFDGFEYIGIENGGWVVIERTGDIAGAGTTGTTYFEGQRSLILENKNLDHSQTEECDLRKYVSIRRNLPDFTESVTFVYRHHITWDGLGYPYNHGHSSGFVHVGISDENGCTGWDDLCIDACGNLEFIVTSEWVEDGLQWVYDGEVVGADGLTWYQLTVPVPPGADPTSLVLYFTVCTRNWAGDTNWWTHIKLFIDNIELQIGTAAESESWSRIKALY